MRIPRLLLLPLILIAHGYPVGAEHVCHSAETYLVDADVLNVRKGPDVTAPVIRTLVDGMTVKACATKKSYSQGGKTDFWYSLSGGGYVWGRYLQVASEEKLGNGYSAIHAYSEKQFSAKVILLHKGQRLCAKDVDFGAPVAVYVSESGRYFILSPGTDVFRGWEVYRAESCSQVLNTDGRGMYKRGFHGERMVVRTFEKLKNGQCQYKDTVFDDGHISESLSDVYADDLSQFGHEECTLSRFMELLD